jgi:hypothetical protein
MLAKANHYYLATRMVLVFWLEKLDQSRPAAKISVQCHGASKFELR